MRAVCLSLGFLLPLAAAASSATAIKPDRAAYATEVCGLMQTHAEANKLPVEFFTRLIWRESFFNDQAVSPAGAEGIAQFMPGTAKLRGLKDSFDYREALPASANYLAALRDQFGNLGLAAAAYNAGEDAVARWLSGQRSSLPEETQDYVLAITGADVHDWKNPDTRLKIPDLGGTKDFPATCQAIVMREKSPASAGGVRRAPRKPWGAQLAGGFSEAKTLKSFSRIKVQFGDLLKNELPMVVRKKDLSRGRKRVVRVMIGRNSRVEAENLCAKLRSAGAACVVAKN
jgi:hypothetical protein